MWLWSCMAMVASALSIEKINVLNPWESLMILLKINSFLFLLYFLTSVLVDLSELKTRSQPVQVGKQGMISRNIFRTW